MDASQYNAIHLKTHLILIHKILVMPWQFLMLNSSHQYLLLDKIPEDQRQDFVAAALNAKYRIKYFDSLNVQRFVEEVNMENQSTDHDETKK
eukprot:483816_1